MRQILLLLVITIQISLFSQNENSYVKFYDNNNLENETIYQVSKLSEDSVMVLSVSRVPDWADPYDWQPKTRSINTENGEIIKEQYYLSSPSYDLYPYRAKLINNSLYFVGEVDYGNITSSYQDEKDYYIAKADLEGNYEWIELNGDSTKYDRLQGIAITSNGDLVVCGTTSRMPSATPNNSLICRHDSLGNKLWCQDFVADISKAYGYDLEIDENGFIYVMGADISSIFSQKKLFIHKITPNGNLVWTEYYEIDQWCLPVEMDMTNDGNLIISAGVYYDSFQSLVPALIEINKDGSVEWVRHYWEELEGSGGWGEKFIKTNAGGYAWCINVIKSDNTYEPTLIVTDKYGEPIIVKKFSEYGILYPEDLVQFDDGSFMIVGNQPLQNDSLYTHWILKTNAEAEVTSLITEEFLDLDISIFPNPVSNVLYVELLNDDIASTIYVKLLDALGRIVLEDKAKSFQNGKNISMLLDGIYYVNIFKENVVLGVKKIIKNSK